MILIRYCTRIAISSAILMLLLGISHGRQLKNIGGVASAASGVDISSKDNGISEMEQELSRVCTDEPSLQYLHFDANLGSTSFKNCSWVGDSPDDRCLLYASNGGRTEIGSTTPDLLRDICPLSCGLCPTDLLDPETDIDRQGNVSTDDFTMEQIKELEIRLRRQKRNHKKKRKGRKPCPCPNGQDHGGGVGGGGGGGGGDDDGNDDGDGDNNDSLRATPPPIPAPVATGAPVAVPVAVPNPTPTPTGADLDDFTTIVPTSYVTGTSTSTWSPTSSLSLAATTTTTWYSSLTTTSIDEGEEAAVIGAFISGQQSSLNKRRSNRRMLAIILTVIPLVLLLLVICCLLRWKKRRAGIKEDPDTDDSDTEYPIHKTKSADSDESRFKKVLGYFNGRQDDARTDVHICTSATCEVCDHSPRRVMSVDSYTDELANPTTLEEGERYRVKDRVKEMEC